MIKKKKSVLLPIFLILITLLVYSSPVDAYYSTATSSPLGTVVGYGGFFNPYAFSPGLYALSRVAASYTPTFNPFGTQFYSAVYNPFDYRLSSSYIPIIPPLPFAPLPVFDPLALIQPSYISPVSPYGSFTLPTSTFSLTPTIPVVSPAPVAPVRTASQSGTWVGTWESTYLAFIVLFHTGPMNLNIVVDPILGGVLGTAVLQGSRYATIPFDVGGVEVNNVITVEGLLSTGFNCILTCILTSPTTMTGFYTVEGTHIPLLDEGIFELTLLTPVLI
ncbi:MAG: hypothetical protein ACMUIA_10635 [bacterium]